MQTQCTHNKGRQTISSPSWTLPYPPLPYPTLPLPPTLPTLAPTIPYPYPTLPLHYPTSTTLSYPTLAPTLPLPLPLPYPLPLPLPLPLSYPYPTPAPTPTLPYHTLSYPTHLASLPFKRKFNLSNRYCPSLRITRKISVYMS